MIKDLIKQIAYEDIELSQALIRSKIIAFKVENAAFKKWISDQLSGYESGYDAPNYRILEVETVGLAAGQFGRIVEIPILIPEKTKQQFKEINFYQYYATESIVSIEKILKNNSDHFVYVQLGPEARDFMERYITLTPGYTLKNLLKKIGKSMYHDILSITKQRLLDTLLELNEKFPNLENEFGTMEEKSKADKIINTHIYGGISNSNFGIGDNVTQNQVINQSQINEASQKLKELGLSENEIIEFQEIVTNKDEKKESIQKRLLNWVGGIAKKSIEKGIELQIPEIIETIQGVL